MFFQLNSYALRFVATGRVMRLGIGAAVVFALVVFVAVFIPWLHDFRRELKFINMEIARNSGRERKHWEKKKRRLLWSICPFVRYRG